MIPLVYLINVTTEMDNTIIFIRHGESTSNKIIHDRTDETDEDIDRKIQEIKSPVLTDLGHVQAQRVSKYLMELLKRENVINCRVCSSTYQRTMQTADPLAKALNTPIHIIEGSQEYTPPKKSTQGEPVDESFESFKLRVHTLMNTLKDKLMADPSSPLIVFGHSLVISYILSSLNREYEDMRYYDGNHLTFQIPNASITTIKYKNDKDKWIASNMSNIFHLGESKTGNSSMVGSV